MDTSTPSCNEFVAGTIHKGQPQGVEEVLHGFNTHVIGNRTTPKAIIVVYSDNFGLSLSNNKLIADAYAYAYAYAKKGCYLVYLLDFFQGDPAKLELEIQGTRYKEDPTTQIYAYLEDSETQVMEWFGRWLLKKEQQ